MLTGEPSLVSMSAALLEAMLEHNSASLATLYQTGVFLFALAYCGSNLVEIGHLFKVRIALRSMSIFPASWLEASAKIQSHSCMQPLSSMILGILA